MHELLDAVLNVVLTAGEVAADVAQPVVDAVVDAGAVAAEVVSDAVDAGADVADAVASAADAVAKAGDAESSEPGLFASIQNFFEAGGRFMYVNLMSLMVLLIIIIERAIRLFIVFAADARMLLKGVVDCLNDGRVDRAIKICRGEDQSKPLNAPIARVFRTALEKADADEMEISRTMEDALMETTPRITERVNFLWPLSNAAVLIGLVGTIIGLIRSFSSMGAVDASKRSEVLSAGISEAMNNTAFGLGIAITGTLCHLVISNKAKKMVDELELYSSRLENILIKRAIYRAKHGDRASWESANISSK